MPLKIKPSRLYWAAGWRQMPSGHDPQTWYRLNAVTVVTMKRNAHTLGCAFRQNIFKDHTIQRDTQGIRSTAIKVDHAAFDRAVVPKS